MSCNYMNENFESAGEWSFPKTKRVKVYNDIFYVSHMKYAVDKYVCATVCTFLKKKKSRACYTVSEQ